MIPICTREEARAFDARAIDANVPSLVLMENAGRGAADAIIEAATKRGKKAGARVAIACGHGNNGGDGFVVARHLLARGYNVTCFFFGHDDKLTTDARVNRDAFVGVGGVVRGGVVADVIADLESADIIVDALFGTGLVRAVEGELADLIDRLSGTNAFRVALDVPSGVDANTGEPLGVAFEADLTVTFAFYKLCHFTPKGRKFSGEVKVCDIGVPTALGNTPSAHATEPRDVAARLSPRSIDSHKYTAGHVAVFGGSVGKLGASLLASHAALRAGAGAATIVTWPDASVALASRVLEVMTTSIEGDNIDERKASIDHALRGKKSAVVGPGFGTGKWAQEVVEHIVATCQCPLVIDADALGVFARKPEVLAVAEGRAILTPHAGELARLLDVPTEDIDEDRFAYARKAAALTKCVVILKGAFSIIALPDGEVVINRTGNPALATAGAGDVLSGIVAAFTCTMSPFEAAWAGAYVHGAAADLWSADHGDRGLVAHEVADLVPRVHASLPRA